MRIKKSWREITLIVLGFLVIMAALGINARLGGWTNAILGLSVMIIGGWPLLPKRKRGDLA